MSYHNTSRRTSARLLTSDTFVRVGSSEGNVVFDEGESYRFARGDIDVLETKAGGSTSETVRFKLNEPGEYSVEACVDEPPPMVTPPVTIRVTR